MATRSFLPRMITGSVGSSSELPLDLQRDGARRLGVAALIYAITFAVMASWGRALAVHHGHVDFAEAFGLRFLPAILSIAFGFAVYVMTRRWRGHPGRLLDLGLFFLVISTFGIAFDTHWGAFSNWDPATQRVLEGIQIPYGVSYECIWLIVYPVLVPNKPLKILGASLLAASSSLLVLAMSQRAGLTDPALSLTELFFGQILFTNHACAVIAWIVSRTVHSMGRHIQRAQEIGQYKLVEKLGEGGMGEVWRAEHQMLARPAAIKLIRPEALGVDAGEAEMVIRRFEREARATAALQSFHTITIYDFGVNDEGAFYYVMELLEGINLEELVREQGPVPAARVVFMLRQVCRSLAEAHRAGLVHRDVKPANLYACRVADHLDWMKVLDFGLVKSDGATRDPEATRLTQQGTFTGTPAYIAPEMLTGEEVDGRADLYSLGCVAYWMLTGQTVFEGANAMAMAIEHARTAPIPPSQRTELEIPEALERLVMQLLAKDPSDRPADADEVEHTFRQLSREFPWTDDAARHWWDRHRPPRPAQVHG